MNIFTDPAIPDWFKIVNLDESHFEKSQYAGENPGKFRLKDLNLLRKVAPNTYKAAAAEVRAYNEYVADEGDGKFKKYKLGRKLGSIPMMDASLHPELMHDAKAQDRYWKDHPELKVNYGGPPK